jgi:hypothetical protein
MTFFVVEIASDFYHKTTKNRDGKTPSLIQPQAY